MNPGLLLLLTLGYARSFVPPSPPDVTVEEGGLLTLPCNASAVSGCVISNPPGWFQTAFCDGKSHNGSFAVRNSTHCDCNLPPSFAEAPVEVQFTAKGGAPPTGPKFKAEFAALWATTLSRRPYLSSDNEAAFVVRLHPSVKGASVSAATGNGTVLVDWTAVQPGATTSVPLSLALLPLTTETEVVLTLRRAGGAPLLERRIPLSRVAAPPPSYAGSVVQVDYATKSLLVDGTQLIGVGYYDSQTIGPSNMTRQAAAGVNWGMRYLTSNDPKSKGARLPDSFVQDYLDWSSKAGMRVMLDVHTWVQALAGNTGWKPGPGAAEKIWAELEAFVAEFKDHPALLGYYVCDDCMTQWLLSHMHHAGTTAPDEAYRRIKRWIRFIP